MTGIRADERAFPADGGHAADGFASYISPMSMGNDNRIDWTAAATPEGEGVVPSLSGNRKPAPRVQTPRTRRDVMDTLLGANDLAATDVGGGDPYNATGRHFRR